MLYRENLRSLMMLDDESAGKVIKAAGKYFIDDAEPNSLSDNEQMAFDGIKEKIDDSLEKYQKKVENGKKSAQKKALDEQPSALPK